MSRTFNSGMSAPTPFPPRQTFKSVKETVVSSFQSSHGWTHSGSGSQEDDTSDYTIGSQSLKLVTAGNGSSCYSTLSISPTDFRRKNLVVVAKVDDFVHYQAAQLQISSNGFADSNYDYCQPTYSSSATQRWIEEGMWTLITVPCTTPASTPVGGQGNWARSGTGANWAAINAIRLRVVDKLGVAITVRFNLIGTFQAPGTGVVSLTFDDSRFTQGSIAAVVMDKYRMRGTAFTVVGGGAATFDGVMNPGSAYMTPAKLKELQDYHGWEIAAHAYSNDAEPKVHTLGYDAVTSTEALEDMKRVKAWLLNYGFRGVNGIALPHGTWSAAGVNGEVLDQVKMLFDYCRTTAYGQSETIPPADPWKLRNHSVANTDTAAGLLAWVDDCAANGYWVILGFHHLTATPSSSSEFSISEFQTFIDGLATRNVDVLPIGDVLRHWGNEPIATTAPVGDGKVATAGTLGTVSDGGHAHPRERWTPADHRLVSWTDNIKSTPNTYTLPVAGTAYGGVLHVPTAAPVNTIDMYVTTAGSGLTSGQCFAAIMTPEGTLLDVTGDQATAWSSTGHKPMALAGGAHTLVPGDYPVIVWFNGTTGPTFTRGAGQSSAWLNLNLTAADYCCFTANTELTTTPPNTLGLRSSFTASIWFGLSYRP